MMHLPAKVEVVHSKTFVAHTKVGHGEETLIDRQDRD